ncbi:DNA methyltransferase [Arthrobacter sp. GCM10027362]|uniref:DNA methyltransferase n=1 Tax=Arthrobacter sp. GCM10027362 TaxID=3273379 RepID=UPI003644D7D1
MNYEQVFCGDAPAVMSELAGSGLREQVRLVYADPPFNTRRDHYRFRDRRSDSAWTDLIERTASAARTLLRQEGSFWLHIDDQQLGPARAACDTALGRDNYIGTVVWEKTRRPSYLHPHLASTTDFLLVYGKDARKLRPFTSGTSQPGKRIPLAHRGNQLVDLSFPASTVTFNCSDGIYSAGDHSSPGIPAALLEDVVIVNGRNQTPLRLRLPSRYSPARIEQLLEAKAQFLVPKVPFRPSYLSPGGKPKLVQNLWSWQSDPEMPTNEDAYKEQGRTFAKPFPGAKPVGLIRRIIELATEDGDLVLDPFGGSGTTAVAALETGRSFILVEERADIVNEYIGPRLEAFGRVPASAVTQARVPGPVPCP